MAWATLAAWNKALIVLGVVALIAACILTPLALTGKLSSSARAGSHGVTAAECAAAGWQSTGTAVGVTVTVLDPLNYGANGTMIASDVLTGTPTTGSVASSDLWQPIVNPKAGANYELLFTFSQVVTISTITFASYGDKTHDPTTMNVFETFSGTLVQSFPTAVGSTAWQTFKLTTPITTNTVGLQFVPNVQASEVAIHHVSFA